MASSSTKGSNLNFLPYIKSTNTKTKQSIKILIDSGANKNIIRPGILPNAKEIEPKHVKNFSGSQIAEKKSKANLLGYDLPLQTYYEIEFHTFFDALIGSEYFAKTGAQLDYKNETLKIDDKTFKFKKFFPAKKLYNHTVTVETLNDGDWLVPSLQNLSKNLTIEPGLYRAENNKTQINVWTTNPIPPDDLPKIGLKLNNFEIIEPIPTGKDGNLDREKIETLIRTQHLSKLEKTKLLDLMYQNQSILLKQNEKLSATSAIKHKIVTADDSPVYTKSYRYPHHFKKDIEEQIEDMLINGIIQPSNSPYNSPIWVVPKKSDASGKKKVRLVIDYRKLNEKTIDDKYPIPQMEEILDNLGKSEYFTTLDLKSGFHQIEMDMKDRIKTAFSVDNGHYEFIRMPFGLKNAPATFQRAMNSILHGLIGNICYVYLDDIIIFGSSLENHLDNIQTVFERLTKNNLKIQLDKCEFLKRETEFLGHVITPEGIKPNPDKVKQILNWALPKTQKQIKQFLGLTGYYRRFIKDYAKLCRPMSKYLKKSAKLNCNDQEYMKAFELLKKIISSDQVLAYPHFDKPFIVTTDASNYALGAVLSQIQDGVERPIAFASRTLNSAEENYSTTEKEALAIIWAVKKFEPYLYGYKFLLITDHKPLTFIKTSDKNSKILRWRLELGKFEYDIKYKEGKSNVVADALSRKIEVNTNEVEELESETDLQTVHSAETSDDDFIHFTERPINYHQNQIIFRESNIETVLTEQIFPRYRRTIIADNNYDKQKITRYLKSYHNGRQSAILAPENLIQMIQEVFREHFLNKGHFIFTNKQVEDVLSDDRQNLLIAKEHDRAHRGITEVESQLKRSYFFPCMKKKISSYINTCKTCNMHKYDRKPYNIKILNRPITEKPFDRVHMDIFIINKENFLSLIDSFSKHLQMIPMRTKNLVDVQKALTKYMATFGNPRLIVTDHETTFVSVQLRNFLNNFGTPIEYASSSESNGQIEKTHSTIIEIYNTNKYKFQNSNTKTIIRASVTLYNNTIHSTTKFTPNEIIFNNTDLMNPQQIDQINEEILTKVKDNSKKKQDIQEKLNENREISPDLNDGQEVFLKPNIRTKTQPRGNDATINQVTAKTFKINGGNIKRNKNKIKRQKKQ